MTSVATPFIIWLKHFASKVACVYTAHDVAMNVIRQCNPDNQVYDNALIEAHHSNKIDFKQQIEWIKNSP